jgi:hypothetical protein
MLSELEAKDSKKKELAKQRLSSLVTKGIAQQQYLVETVTKMVIVDRLVGPRSMRFFIRSEDNDPNKTGVMKILYERPGQIGGDDRFIHNHALGQLASVAGMPKVYVNTLLTGPYWRQELLCYNLDDLYHKGVFLDRKKEPAKFLHRMVGNELRGFLSRSYNRKLLTAPLLRAFVEACAQHSAGPVSAYATPVRTGLKCMVPYVFEPIDGEFVSFGVTFSNSDFGAGRTKVSGTVMRISSGTISVLADKFSRVHLSSIIEESDIEMSDETADKELQAHKSAIKDAVTAQVSDESIERMIRTIQVAHENQIPWYKLKDKLGKVLQKKDLDFVEQLLKSGGDSIVDLPPAAKKDDDYIATGWWAANVLGWMANRESDEDKRADLQQLAGEVIAA